MVVDAPLSPVERYLKSLHQRFRGLVEGAVATYIPELAKADPDHFGICVATTDGHVYEVGDSRCPFTLQSISKPFVYGLALEDRGKAAVLARIGVEPTGDAFNEISLEEQSGRPRNPMINAGAIAASSLIAGRSPEDRWNRVLTLFSLYAGHRLELDQPVYGSERATGHRNRAIGHMLRNFGILTHDPEDALDLYFRQCSIRVDCRDLAVMAATLASGGQNPVTRERALEPRHVDEVLSVMTTCGMYDFAGEWVYRVGLPAKSGVSGGVLAVLPGRLGIGVYSPRLDAHGNSVRGVAVCTALSDEMELHFLRAPRASLSAVRSRFSLRELGSRRRRSDAERALLAERGRQALCFRLQGDLDFAAMEHVARRIAAERPEAQLFVLDLEHVHDVDPPAAQILLELLEMLHARKRSLVFVGLEHHPRLRRRLEEARSAAGILQIAGFDELDLALEWCEDALLAGDASREEEADELPLDRHELLAGLSTEQLALLASLLERRELAPRQLAVRTGEPASELFLVVRGRLSVVAEDHRGRLRRLATLSAGMGFGEAALVDAVARSASVRADCASVCWLLSRDAARALDHSSPSLKIRLLENLLRSSARIVSRLSIERLAGETNGLR